MNVVVQGRQRRFISADIGGTPVQEIWLGDKQIWPNMEGVATRIVVALPQVGTLDWLYWLHSVDSTKDKATPSNYMKITIDGMDFFINHSYDGTVPYVLNGNTLTIDVADGVLIDQLGESLEVEAKIPSREAASLYGTQFNDWHENVFESKIWDLPLLPDSKIKVIAHKGANRDAAYLNNINIKGLPSGNVYLHQAGYTENGKGRYHFGQEWIIRDVVLSDNAMEGTLNLYGSADYTDTSAKKQGLFPVYPAFSRRFKLRIISVD